MSHTLLIIRLLLILGILIPVPSWAAIAFVSNTSFTAGASVTTLTVSATVAATNTTMIVCTQARGNTASQATGVTFNGTALTLIREDVGCNNQKTQLWKAYNPAVTTANVVITWPDTASTIFTANGNVLQYTGVDSTVNEASAGSTGSSTTPSVNILTVSDLATVIDCAIGLNASGLTIGAGQTVRRNTTANSIGHGSSSVEGRTPVGTEVMDWTQTTAAWATSAVALKPGVVVSTLTDGMMMMGVGK